MSVKFKDYYKVLGVEKTATADEIRKAYRTLVKKYHPDKNKDDPSAADRFRDISEAYEVLKDDEKRQKYDTFGSGYADGQPFDFSGAGQGGSPFGGVRFSRGGGGFRSASFGGNSPFSDFFSAMFGEEFANGSGFGGDSPFGAGFGSTATERHARPRHGEDSVVELPLTIEELCAGGKKKITLSVSEGQPDGSTRNRRESYDVDIPRGVKEGSKIRLSGRGGRGINGGESGDLLFMVKLEPDSRFEVEGLNVSGELRLSAWDAALGGSFPVETPRGRAELKVPSGASSGAKYRLKGMGLPGPGGTDGDFIARIMIDVPKKLTTKQKDLFQQLRDAAE